MALEPQASYVPVPLPDAAITEKIHVVRGQKVMLDRDLAELYEVATKHLKRQVRRNHHRFPADFMFELTSAEQAALRCQIGTSNEVSPSERGGSRVLPMAFTEQGVAMLSSVLNSERAVQVNILIIRVFTRMRELLITQKDILLKLEQLERKAVEHDESIQTIFQCLKELLNPPAEPRPAIGYKRHVA